MIDWSKVDSATDEELKGNGFKTLPAGKYIVYIAKAIHNEAKQNYELLLDIAEGEYKNIGADNERQNGNDWSYKKLYCSYKVTEKFNGQRQFKRLLEALEASNGRKFKIAKFTGNAADLEGLEFGIVMDESVYNGKKVIKPNYFLTYDVDTILTDKSRDPHFLTDDEKAKLEQQKPLTYGETQQYALNEDEVPF